MSAKKYKCPVCGESSIAEDMVKIGTRHYHMGECENIKKNGGLEQTSEQQSRSRLFYYICDLYGINKPTGMMFKQISTYKKDYGYTDDGIYETLRYYYETLGNEVLDGTGIGIVPYYYEKAKQHCNDIWDIEDYMEGFIQEERERIVKAKTYNTRYEKHKERQIEISINWEEDEDE